MKLNELKSFWNQVQDDQDDLLAQASFSTDTVNGPGILCGVVRPVGIDELLATIPPKCSTDKLVKLFFDERESPIPTFRWFPDILAYQITDLLQMSYTSPHSCDSTRSTGRIPLKQISCGLVFSSPFLV
jgi:hypothetical protein